MNEQLSQIIKCSVHDCKYCEIKKNQCIKKSIKICNCSLKDTKESTMCDSYKIRIDEL